MIRYSTDVDALDVTQLGGPFFVGWPDPPDPDTHLRILRSARHAVVALDADAVVGFVTGLSDGVLSAFIPLLEVTPAWRGRGIGSELVRRLLVEIGQLYAVDAVCDPELVAFYERLGFRAGTAVTRREYGMQAGSPS
jgi:ribosomal protein S18 acetylase RimI-like enzyme